jgi:DNA uptake protein ComE-like DNA-binding protein
MKDRLRDIFTFSAGERKGIIILVIIIILLNGINMIVVIHRPAPKLMNYPQWMDDSENLSPLPGSDDRSNIAYEESLPGIGADESGKSLFDPNEASVEELLRDGVSLHISRTILKYRSKGGVFYKPEDLMKIYGMSPELYKEISPYIRIKKPESVSKRIQVPADRIMDLNSSDSVMFVKLPGIGPVLARRLIKYRSLLGGYYSTEQLKEVYGISDSLYRQIMGRLVADTSNLVRINLNTATEKEMARHPYIGKFAASGIVRYRTGVVNIKNSKELEINGLIPRNIFLKLKHYLSV